MFGPPQAAHEHIATFKAAYEHRGRGHILFSPVGLCDLSYLFQKGTNAFAGWAKLDHAHKAAHMHQWYYCLATAVSSMHARFLWHHDLKPGNVIITNDLKLIVIDFGLSGISNAPGSSTGSSTGTNAFMRGSQKYAPPEHRFYKNYKSGPEADIWYLGLTFFELLGYSWFGTKAWSNWKSYLQAKHSKTKSQYWTNCDAKNATSYYYFENDHHLQTYLEDRFILPYSSQDGTLITPFVKSIAKLIQKMVASEPLDRPTAPEVKRQVWRILQEVPADDPTKSVVLPHHCKAPRRQQESEESGKQHRENYRYARAQQEDEGGSERNQGSSIKSEDIEPIGSTKLIATAAKPRTHQDNAADSATNKRYSAPARLTGSGRI